MAVFEVTVVPIVIPFVQIAHVTDGVGMKALEYIIVWGYSIATYRTGGNGVGEQFTDNGQIGRSPIAGHPVITLVGDIFILRRCAGCRNQFTRFLGILHKPFHAKLSRSFHQRVCNGLQVFFILCEKVSLPQGVHQPCPAQVPVCPHRILPFLAHGVRHGPDVGIMTAAPSLFNSIVVLCRERTVLRERFYETVKRHGHLCEIRSKGRPVVLLEVDVHRIVSPPWRPPLWSPKSLQVCGHSRSSGTADEQIASVLEIKRL